VLSALLALGLVLVAGCIQAEPETKAQIIEDITPEEAFALIENNRGNPDFAILDVRTPEEFADGYIEGAINLDYQAENFSGELSKLDKNKTYLVYCRSGKRSAGALNIMAELGFREVYNMTGGIIDWEEAGLATIQ